MSKFLYPIFKLPNEYKQDLDVQEVPLYIKWWLYNHYKKSHSYIISEIITGNPLTLNDSVQAKFPMPPLPGGNSEQVQYSGKNKFDISGLATTNSNFSCTTNNDKVTITATGTVGAQLVTKIITGLDATKNYTISFKAKKVLKGTDGDPRIVMTLFGSNDGSTWTEFTFLGVNPTQGTEYSFNKTLTGYSQYRFRLYNNVSTPVTIGEQTQYYDIQLEEGSTATSYEPYVGGTASPNPSYPQEITNVTGDVEVLVQNKNLLKLNVLSNNNYNNNSYAVIGNIAEFKCNYYVERELSIGENFINQKVLNTSDCTTTIKLKGLLPNTQYTISGDVSTNITGSVLILGTNYATVPNKVNNTIITDANGEKTLTHFYIATRTAGMYLNISNIQLEPGTTASTYTPHQEQTFTFPLGTQRMYLGDYLADDGIHHVRKQIELTGNENWLTHTAKTWGSICYLNLIGILKDSVVLSNQFVYYRNLGDLQTDVAINKISSSIYGNNYLYLGSSLSNNTALKSWLAEQYANNNSIIVEYELATEEITPYTTEQQQAYDEIKQAISYYEQTNISGSSDESNPLFEVQYYKRKEE